MTDDILSTVCESVRETFCATTCLRVTSCLCNNLKILRTLLLNVSKNGSNSGPACLVTRVYYDSVRVCIYLIQLQDENLAPFWGGSGNPHKKRDLLSF
jgi:hypothetical protein